MQIFYQGMWLTVTNISARCYYFPHFSWLRKPARELCQPISVHCFVPFTCSSVLMHSSLMLQKRYQLKVRLSIYSLHHGGVYNSFTEIISGQCVKSDELEGLRYRLYSELSESKKEIDTLRNDLQYWKNETLTILKNYFILNESKYSWDNYATLCCSIYIMLN